MSYHTKNSVKSNRVHVTARGPRSNDPRSHPPGVVHAMTSFQLQDLAYAKVIIHALKYPHRTVNGVLLGHPPSSGTVVIVDAVPLQHHWINLSPAMEVGLGMVRSASFLSSFSTLTELRISYPLCGHRLPIMPTVAGFMSLDTTRHQSTSATQLYPLSAGASQPK